VVAAGLLRRYKRLLKGRRIDQEKNVEEQSKEQNEQKKLATGAKCEDVRSTYSRAKRSVSRVHDAKVQLTKRGHPAGISPEKTRRIKKGVLGRRWYIPPWCCKAPLCESSFKT